MAVYYLLLTFVLQLCRFAVSQLDCSFSVACPNGQCCNYLGQCGTGLGFCDSTFCSHQCPTPECGIQANNAGCKGNQCCNIIGFCGTGNGFCDAQSCQNQCPGNDTPSDSSPPAEDNASPPPKGRSSSSNPSSKVPGDQTPRKKKKKSQGWIAGVVVPVALVASCLGFFYKKRRDKKKQLSSEINKGKHSNAGAKDGGEISKDEIGNHSSRIHDVEDDGTETATTRTHEVEVNSEENV